MSRTTHHNASLRSSEPCARNPRRNDRRRSRDSGYLIARFDPRRARTLRALHRGDHRRPGGRHRSSLPHSGCTSSRTPRRSAWFPLSASAAPSAAALRTGSPAPSPYRTSAILSCRRSGGAPSIGVDSLSPPGPGRAVTIVDSGVDVTHPEFLGRANTEMLNDQEPAGLGGEHGTAVGSIVGVARQRPRPRRRLSRGGAPLVGRREGCRNAARDVPDRAGHPRCRESWPGRGQPEPWRRAEGRPCRAGDLRGGEEGDARRRGVGEQRRGRQPARLPGEHPSRADGWRNRRVEHGRLVLESVPLRRSLGTRRRDPDRDRAREGMAHG